jgi:hypothetical protein
MKTGTTFIQDLLNHNREALLETGFLVPGEGWTDQSRAVREVLGFSITDPRGPGESSGMWEELSGQMLAHRGTASVLSMEFLSFSSSEQAARIVEELREAEVHVVLTVRDAASAIAAQWQTACRNGSKVTLRRFVQGVGELLDSQDPRGRAPRMFQRTQDVARMLDVWVPLVGRGRVHVVTVPPRGSDPDLLWNRFAHVVGFDPAVCTDRTVDPNPSLGLASSELVRLVNAELGDVAYFDYARTVKRQLARVILGSRAAREPRVQLNRRGLRLAARWNERTRAAVARHRVDVVGSLEDLPVEPPGSEHPQALPTPSPAQLLAAAATGLDGLRSWQAYLEHRLAAAARGEQLADPIADADVTDVDDPTPPDRWGDQPDPVQSAVSELVRRLRTCMELRNRVEELLELDEQSATSLVPADAE